MTLRRLSEDEEEVAENKYLRTREACVYNHSGDDGKEVPPVPIPNTEVKLFYAESTCRVLRGG